MSKVVSERFPSARELGDALAEALGLPARAMQKTLPDEHHRRAPWQAPPERQSLRTFVGGVALGAMLGIAALQLSQLLRETEPQPAANEAGGHAPIAWLAERSPKRALETAPTTSAKRTAHAAPSAAASASAPAGSPSSPQPAELDAVAKPAAAASAAPNAGVDP
jgi:hypothetical protein